MQRKNQIGFLYFRKCGNEFQQIKAILMLIFSKNSLFSGHISF